MSEIDDNQRVTLTEADAAAMDAVLDGQNGAADAARKARVEAWLAVLGTMPVPEPRGDLAQRALAAVGAIAGEEPMKLAQAGGRQSTETRETRGGWRWRRHMAEYAAMGVAACLLLAVTLVGLNQAKMSNARAVCAGNMRQLGIAFAGYAGNNNGQLPMIAMSANGNWLRGDPATGAKNNAANLIPLLDRGLVKVEALFCKGAGVPKEPVAVEANALPVIGYSYRNLYGDQPPRWDGSASTIVLTDKNPLFADGKNGGMSGDENRNSPNHEGHGNYILRADGDVTWDVNPNCGPSGDNIWTLGSGAQRLLVYNGTERPSSSNDVFVCP